MATPQRLIALTLALLAGTAPAQPPAAEEEVVVTGRNAEARERAAQAFVRGVSSAPVDGQFARWRDPLCPAVSGLDLAIGARVVARIRDAAQRAGAPLAAATCRPNVLITFTGDAQGLLATMERKQPRLLESMPLADRRTLRADSAPVLWWYGTHTESADGSQLAAMPSAAIGPTGSSGPALPSGGVRYGDSYSSSLIDSHLRVNIASAVVLVDVQRSTGHRLDAIADYVAFVVLARIRSGRPAGEAETILSLFAGAPADAPRGLSAEDRAYLAALYTISPNRKADAQARALVGAVARALPVD